jgi:serine/tyrosine/threonine adenylyltransferase
MKLENLNFNNHFQKLGVDFFAKALPTSLKNQKVIAYSANAAKLIDLDVAEIKSKKFSDIISAKKPHPKFCYLSQIYGGHQFGHYAGKLGDGRAILLSQIKNKKNESWDLVLKGSGLTPYSRTYIQNSDGKSVLRSAIREFLISESMFHLGIPTSRALCLIASDDFAIRETVEPAAQIIRLAQSHVRFGTFELFFYQKQNDKIKILADYVIEKNFPEAKNNYAKFLEKVVESTAKTIAKWQAFGFCHGVLNTDNMSILGITFDYGPFGFLDEYNPHHICNHSDQQGRYSYINQPAIGMWNLNAFAITLSSLISMEEIKEIVSSYEKIFLDEYHDLMAKKLGFERCDEEIKKLIYEVLELLEKHQIDYTNFFRGLAELSSSAPPSPVTLGAKRRESHASYTSNQNSRDPRIASDSRMTSFVGEDFKITDSAKNNFDLWHKKYSELLKSKNISNTSRKKLITTSNPKFILRNHLLQTAIEKAYAGDFSEVKKLQKIMEKPFAEQKENESYASLPPAWAKEIVVSCSS